MAKIDKSVHLTGFGTGEQWYRLLSDLVDDLAALTALVNDLKAKYDDLVTKYNAHTHIENTAASYTQNATTAAVAAGSQGSTTAADAVTLKTSK